MCERVDQAVEAHSECPDTSGLRPHNRKIGVSTRRPGVPGCKYQLEKKGGHPSQEFPSILWRSRHVQEGACRWEHVRLLLQVNRHGLERCMVGLRTRANSWQCHGAKHSWPRPTFDGWPRQCESGGTGTDSRLIRAMPPLGDRLLPEDRVPERFARLGSKGRPSRHGLVTVL